MRIVIDCRWIRSKKIDGIGRYTWNVTKELLRQDRENEYVLLFADEGIEKTFMQSVGTVETPRRGVSTEILSYPVLSLKDFFYLRRDLARLKPDVIFCPNYLAWPFSLVSGSAEKRQFADCSKVVLALHDVLPYFYPEVRRKLLWKFFYKLPVLMQSTLQKADGLVAVSTYTKNQVEQLFALPTDKIKVVPNGVEDRFFQEISREAIAIAKAKYRIPAEKQYIFCLGRVEPYKNIDFLKSAWSNLPQKITAGFCLVLAGETPSGHNAGGILPSNVIRTGYVADEDLPALYQGSDFFVMPSLYEGFGLPILEALASGVRVLASDIAPFREIGGSLINYFDPSTVDDLREKLRQALSHKISEAEARRYRTRARAFRWAETVRQILNIFSD